jgi:hypothetical protein
MPFNLDSTGKQQIQVIGSRLIKFYILCVEDPPILPAPIYTVKIVYVVELKC